MSFSALFPKSVKVLHSNQGICSKLRTSCALIAISLAVGACTGPAGLAPELRIGRVIMVDGIILPSDSKGEVPTPLTSGVWGAIPDAMQSPKPEDKGVGAAIQFTGRPDGFLLLDIVPARATGAPSEIRLSGFNAFATQKGYRPADFAYAPDVPVKLIPVGNSYLSEFSYGSIHMLGLLQPVEGAKPGYDWNVWLDEQYLAKLLPSEPNWWWSIRGFFSKLFGIDSDTAVEYRWETHYLTPDGEVAGKDIRFTKGGAALANFVRRHANQMFLRSRAVRLRLLSPRELKDYEARPRKAPTVEEEQATQ